MHACLNAIVKHDVDRDGRVDRYHCRTLIDTTPEVLVSLPRTAIPTSNHGIHDELGRLHPRPARHFVNTRHRDRARSGSRLLAPEQQAEAISKLGQDVFL
jgi:hypothetical protein